MMDVISAYIGPGACTETNDIADWMHHRAADIHSEVLAIVVAL